MFNIIGTLADKANLPWEFSIEESIETILTRIKNGNIILAEKIYENKKKFYSNSWNFGPKEANQINVMKFAEILKRKMGSNSKIICNKKFDDREKKYLDLNRAF